MPYLTAIFLFIVGAWGKQLVKIIWYAVYHIPILILQAVASFFGSTVRIQLKKINAEDTFLYRLVEGVNFLDLFCIFFICCMLADPNSLPEIIEETGGLMIIGFIFPFIGSVYIHSLPYQAKKDLEKENEFEKYQSLPGKYVVILPNAYWSARDSLANIDERGKEVSSAYLGKQYKVECIEYFNDRIEAQLKNSERGVAPDERWIPAKYLECVDTKVSTPQ